MGRHGRKPQAVPPLAPLPVPPPAAVPSALPAYVPMTAAPAGVPTGFDFFAPAPAAAPAVPTSAMPLPAPPPPPPAWPPQPAYPPPAPPVPVATHEEPSESGLPVGIALTVTIVAVVLSGLLLDSGHLLFHRSDVLDLTLRRALVYELGFYVLLGLALLVFVQVKRVRLVWHRGGVAAAILLGAPLGAVGGLLGVGANSAIAGHLASDPNVTMLVGGGGALRIMAALVTTAALAPLVEETIFRGICAGSFLRYGVAAAVWSSAIAFALWHHNPAALRYYALMGLVFAAIWRKRGLVASMSAHAAFNGVLTIAAVMATSGVGNSTTFGDIALLVPGGWHVDSVRSTASFEMVEGPSGSAMVLLAKPQSESDQTIAQLETRLQALPAQTGVTVDPTSIREVPGTLGTMLSASFTADSQPGHVLAFPFRGSVYEVMMITAGNPAAEREWADIVHSIGPA